MSAIAEAAEQFVEKMTDAENAPAVDESAEGTPETEGERKLTLEERKAKMEKLRQRMVCCMSHIET